MLELVGLTREDAPARRRALAGLRWHVPGLDRVPARDHAVAGAWLARVRHLSVEGSTGLGYRLAGALQAWAPADCPECRVQVVAGLGDVPVECLYDGRSGPFPGERRQLGLLGRRVLFIGHPDPIVRALGERLRRGLFAPTAELDLRWMATAAPDCAAAKALYRTAPPAARRRLGGSGTPPRSASGPAAG